MKSYRILIITLSVFLTFILFPTPTSPQDSGNRNHGTGTSEDPYIVPKSEAEIKVDAVLDEQAWEKALILELKYEVRPGENVPPPVRTEVLLTYDKDNLYAAFRCYDPEPSSIRAHLRDRDTLGGDDWIALIFDTFNDNRRSFDFLVTAQGVQLDQIEAQSGEDPGWDTIWDCSSKITEWGYTVEIAIPFSSLRFQRREGPQIWGFDAVRRYPREHAYHIGLFSRDRSNNCYMCQAVKIKGFEGASPGRNIEINPTVIGARTDDRPEFPEGDLKKRDQDAEFGLTARWGMTPNLTLNLTANPDFSQVEADALQLDINQPFALFYPERRPFFTEGTDFFSALENMIYTRTIRNPSWGIKLTGKEGANTMGAYMLRDEVTNLIFPGSQGSTSTSLDKTNISSVIRYKRDLGSRYTVGLLATDREGKDYFNRVYGFDLDFRVTRTNQFQLLVMGSSTKYPTDVASNNNQPSGTFNDRLISFEYDHYTRTWGWWADYEDAGPEFRTDLGYYPRVGYRNAEGGLLYTWNAKPGSWWSLFRVGSEFNYYEDHNGALLNKTGSLWFQYTGTMQSNLSIRGWINREGYNKRQFDQTFFLIEGSFWPTSNLMLYANTVFGEQIDYANTRLGKRFRLSPYLTYNLGKHMRFSFGHSFERMTVQDVRLYTANISQSTAVYQFNVRTFFRAIIQYVDYDYNTSNYTFPIDSEYRRFFAQFLFSYKINARTVLFLGYSDNYFGAQAYGLTQSDRTFFVKLGYAWVL
ncbi:MAG: carbohydrate binding family 9 domain-containing protein [Candidatus Aminicenantes bacterium]|nr:MAG: carbohydrate binding family 9 domain-containing protein [Candidatus Aminicenantes bacterium]